MNPLWPHQERGIAAVGEAIRRGIRRVGLTSPTGMGKTRLMAELIRADLAAGLKVSLYTNRRMLLTQSAGVFRAFGLSPGIRAAGHHPDPELPLQIHTVQTEDARTRKSQVWETHPADRVYFDEAHLMTGDVAARLAGAHLDVPGCVLVYVTATPIGLGNVCDELVVAGTTSEGRKCGALVPAFHYGPSEPFIPDVQKRTLDRGEDLTEKEVVKAIMRPGIFGLVFENHQRLNPHGLPAILFAPGVAESLWFAEQFVARGVSAAHIDGETVWINGREYRSDRAARDAAMEGSRVGDIRVLCNRFVLREGIDAPWLQCGILATIFGSLQSYLQSGGRLLRSHPGKDRCLIIDHGGSWHRMGSLNADREWDLSLTAAMIAGERAERLRNKQDAEPLLCPQCKCVLARMVPGRSCPACGFEFAAVARSRPVVMADGRLVEQGGDIYKPRVRKETPTSTKKWVSTYFRAFNSGTMTFRQAEALFVHENGFYPLANLKFMPKTIRGWYLRVCDVPREELFT